jgi:Na+/proline symporter
VYRPLAPTKPDRHYITVGRLASLIVVAGGVSFAFWVPGVVEALDFWFKISPMMGIAFWMGLFWRRATPLGAWAATLTGFGVWWMTTRPEFVQLVLNWPLAEQLRLIWQEGGSSPQIYEPWVIVLYTGSAILAGVVVSLLTPRVPHDRLQRFYDLTRTPIQEGEVVSHPCAMPEGVTAPPRRMLVTAFDLEVPMPSATSWVGFIAGWIAVGLLVWTFNLIVGGTN